MNSDKSRVDANSSPPDGLPPLPDPQPAGAVSINRRRWWVHLFLISAYILLVGLFGMEHSEAHTHIPVLSHTSRGLLIVCTIELLVFALVLGLTVVASRASRDDLLLRWRRGFWPVPLGIGYSVAIRLAVGIIMMAAGIALTRLPQYRGGKKILGKLVDGFSGKYRGTDWFAVQTVV